MPGAGGQPPPQRTTFRPPWVKDGPSPLPMPTAPWTLNSRRDSKSKVEEPPPFTQVTLKVSLSFLNLLCHLCQLLTRDKMDYTNDTKELSAKPISIYVKQITRPPVEFAFFVWFRDRQGASSLSDQIRTYATRNDEESGPPCAVFFHSDIRFQSHQA